MLNKQSKTRSYDDVINAYHNFSYRWMDFLGNCPDLLNTYWFYESAKITDSMAMEMRRLVSVLVMLYGTDLIRVIMSVLDYDLAKEYRNYIFAIPREQAVNEDMRVIGLEILLHLLHRRDLRVHGAPNDLYHKFTQMMEAQNVDYFQQALDRYRRTNLSSHIDSQGD